MTELLRASGESIRRARWAILTIAATYVLSVAAGIAMVGTGNLLALERRDEIVGAARSSDITVALRGGDRVRAALLDFASNTVASAVSLVAGVSIIGAFPIAAYRGWVGGIVSVDARHQSRLIEPEAAVYYVVTLLLQLTPYSISGGMGVHVGLGAWRGMRTAGIDTWLGLPKARLRDAVLAYVIVAPMFLVASLWEFLLA